MRKIVTVVGARPQYVKAAPISRELRKALKEVLVDTGQHYDFEMSGIFFEELHIPKPDYNLGVGSGSHGAQTGEMLKKVEEVLQKEQPDAVLTYGDTNSTIAASLAASKMHIPVFHIEAGLRSFNKKMPEEINRVLTDHVSDLLFAPTENAVQNLKNEGVTKGVLNVGDVMYDAFLYNLEIALQKYTLDTFELKNEDYILATIHRAENTDDKERLTAIFESLADVGTTVVLPLHPRTQKYVKQYGLEEFLNQNPAIKIIEPLSYLEMIYLLKHAKGVVTDSGGVQKEAFFSRVPCFTLRNETEWVETVQAGWNTLVDPIKDNLGDLITKEIPKDEDVKPYGDGHSSEKIVKHILEYFK